MRRNSSRGRWRSRPWPPRATSGVSVRRPRPERVDAWRAFAERVAGFAADVEWHGKPYAPWLHFERLAVTPEQIMAMGLPTRPTKAKDSRAGKFAGESVEVDAIPAPVLRQLCEDAITRHIDAEALRLTRIAEVSERARPPSPPA